MASYTNPVVGMDHPADVIHTHSRTGDPHKSAMPGAAGVTITPPQRMIASCVGAVVTSLFVTPMDVVKIRLQSQRKPFHKGDKFIYRNGLMDHIITCVNGDRNGTQPRAWYRKPGYFNGTIDAVIKIARYEGITSLWTGLPPTMVMAVPGTVIYFTTYDTIRESLRRTNEAKLAWWKPVLAGCTARVWAITVICPLELVRTKMQSEQLTYRYIGQALRTHIQAGGVRSLWRGLGPTLLRDVPFSAIYWCGYETMKSHLLESTGATDLRFTESFTCGAICGTIAGILTLPFDVIKTHRQIELGKVDVSKEAIQKVSTAALMSKLYRHSGVPALFAGIVPRIVKIAPSCAIMISSYEFFKSFFHSINNDPSRTKLKDTTTLKDTSFKT